MLGTGRSELRQVRCDGTILVTVAADTALIVVSLRRTGRRGGGAGRGEQGEGEGGGQVGLLLAWLLNVCRNTERLHANFHNYFHFMYLI